MRLRLTFELDPVFWQSCPRYRMKIVRKELNSTLKVWNQSGREICAHFWVGRRRLRLSGAIGHRFRLRRAGDGANRCDRPRIDESDGPSEWIIIAISVRARARVCVCVAFRFLLNAGGVIKEADPSVEANKNGITRRKRRTAYLKD